MMRLILGVLDDTFVSYEETPCTSPARTVGNGVQGTLKENYDKNCKCKGPTESVTDIN